MGKPKIVFFFCFIFFFLLIGSISFAQNEQTDIEEIEYIEYALSDQAVRLTDSWAKFKEFDRQITDLKLADFSSFRDAALIQSHFSDMLNQVPEALNENSVLVRIKVLETAALKLESISSLNSVDKETKLDYIQTVLVAYSNLMYTINKVLEKQSQSIGKP